jgi:hypothetical protein
MREMALRPQKPPRDFGSERDERVVFDVVVVIAAIAATKVISIWAFAGFAPEWMVLVIAVMPAGLAGAWTLHRAGRWHAIAVGVIALVACLAVAAWSWVPAPAYFAPVRDHEAAADAVAEHAFRIIPWGQCVDANTLDLGPLAALGPWSEACVWGPPSNRHLWSFSLNRARGSRAPRLTFSGGGAEAPDLCAARVAGDWWASLPPVLTAVVGNCPHGFGFQGAP